MKDKITPIIATAMILMSIAGCSRTVEDVAKWESNGNTEKLKDALTDPKFEVRQAAAQSLGTLKADHAVDALAACLNDSEESVQLAAIDALADIGTPDTVTPLTAAFKLDSKAARLKAAEALGTLRAEGAIEVLAEGLYSSDEAVQLAACHAIGNIGSEAGSQALAGKLASGSASTKMKAACIAALARTGGDVALSALVEALADEDERIREEATTALIRIGRPAIPSVIEGLRSGNATVRSASIKLLRGLGAIPARGSGLVWYQLARASLDDNPEVRAEAVATLAARGDEAVPTLIEAASLNVPEIREYGAQALELIGDPALEQTMNAAEKIVMFETQQWFKDRKNWIGAPSPLLDLYAAISILNPDFSPPENANAILTSASAVPDRAEIPALVKMLGEDGKRPQVVRRLSAAGSTALLPLIAAVRSSDATIAEASAALISDRKDTRALQPLLEAVERRVEAGEALSKSPLYIALLKLDKLEAEPVVLKVRPTTERAMVVFNRQYRDAKIVGAVTTDQYADNEAPITFRIAYTENGNPGTLEVTFKKDDKGNWHPSPALPYALPKPNK